MFLFYWGKVGVAIHFFLVKLGLYWEVDNRAYDRISQMNFENRFEIREGKKKSNWSPVGAYFALICLML